MGLVDFYKVILVNPSQTVTATTNLKIDGKRIIFSSGIHRDFNSNKVLVDHGDTYILDCKNRARKRYFWIGGPDYGE